MNLKHLHEQDITNLIEYYKIISSSAPLFSSDKGLQIIEFLHIIKKHKISTACIFQIILTDQKTIFANCITCSSNSLIISIPFNNENTIIIPLKYVAGINIIEFSEDEVIVGKELIKCPAINKSSYDFMGEISLTYAKRNNLNILYSMCEYQIGTTKTLKWGDLSYKIDTALYADWNYLQTISGGINALGIGIGIFNLSSGWSKSLWSQFKNKVQHKSIDIDKISLENDAVIKGYISFIENYHNLPSLEHSIETVKMEGATWIPAIISNKKIFNTLDIRTAHWALVYLKEDGLMFPLNVWDRFTEPINIYCEIIHITISTEFGNVPFYLKARCAAYVKD